MTKYDMLYILAPELEEEAREVIIKKFEDLGYRQRRRRRKDRQVGHEKTAVPHQL